MCTGDEMMRHLLLHTSMFTRLDNDCLLQVCVCVLGGGGLECSCEHARSPTRQFFSS